MRLPYSEDGEQGTWRFVPAINGHRCPVFMCPDCKQLCSLHEHEVEADGKVFPVVFCANRNACGFTDYIELMDWVIQRIMA